MTVRPELCDCEMWEHTGCSHAPGCARIVDVERQLRAASIAWMRDHAAALLRKADELEQHGKASAGVDLPTTLSTPGEPRKYVETWKAIAALLGRSDRAARYMASRRRDPLPVGYVGKMTRMYLDDFDAWLRRQMASPPADSGWRAILGDKAQP